MDGQDHKITAASAIAGHEGHGVHLCHRCGWPFPNPHPSAKHRRAHKRVCGKVEGYEIIQSGDHLAASDDDNASDDDEQHTPSPDIVKKNVESSGRGGEKSARSEDVFSDAVTDFSDSGISPRLEERFESVKKLDKESVEGDLHESVTSEVEEANDTTVQPNDPRIEEISYHGPLANGNNLPDNVVPVTDTATKSDSVELVDDSLPEHGVGEGVICETIPGHDKDIQAQEHRSVSFPEEGKVLDRKESGYTLHDKLISEPLQTLDAPEKSTSTKIVESADNEVSQSTENIGHSESVGENTLPDKSLLSASSVKPNNEDSDVACTASSIDKEDIPKASLDESEGGKSEITGSVDVNSALGSTMDACEDDTTTIKKKDIDHCGENDDATALETGNGKGDGVPVEVEVITDCIMPSGNSADVSSSFVADGDAKSLHQLSENHSNEVKSSEDKVTEVLQSVGPDANHEISDAIDKNSLPTSEVANNIHVAEDVPEAKCRDVAETPEDSIPKETTILLSANDDRGTTEAANNIHVADDVPVAKCQDVAETPEDSIPLSSNDDRGTTEAANASDSIMTAKDLKSNVVSPTPTVQEASSDIMQTCSSDDDLTTSKSVDITPSAEQLKSLPLDECSETTTNTPSVKQPVSSPSDFHGASDTVDDTTPVNVTSISTRSVLPELDDKSTMKMENASAVDSLTSRSDSLEANCGSVVSDTLETNSQKQKTTTEEANSDKSDTFEPPSFMTLVQSGSEGDQATAATEIEAVNINQQPKSDALQAGWFPSITNVVNESEGRKKNEEMIAKVTNWSPVKQQHGPLKSLLNEVKSPNTKQVPSENQKVEAETKDNGVSSVVVSETHTTKNEETEKHVEEWNSPARYPIEVKKEKKKGRSFWVSFVCCSSAHRDL